MWRTLNNETKQTGACIKKKYEEKEVEQEEAKP